MNIDYYKKYEPLFGAWHITKQIGEGAYGRVYIIERHELGQTYKSALKAITIPSSRDEIKNIMSDGMSKQDTADYYKNIAHNIVNEFILMSKLKGNSHIVSYEDHVIIEHQDDIGWDILIRMELLTPLVDITSHSQLDETEVIKLGIDLCKALELCRIYNIIHRDVKPENIFVSPSGDYKIGDFGIARIIEKTKTGLSRKGTDLYMAPEIYRGSGYGAAVDIYSLGIVMYKLLNENRLPFMPEYPKTIKPIDKEEALHKRLTGKDIPEPRNGSPELKSIVLKACSYKPENRYGSADEMRAELEVLRYETTGGGNRIAVRHGNKPVLYKKAAAIVASLLILLGVACAFLIPDEVKAVTGINDSENIYIDETLSPEYHIEPARMSDEPILFTSKDEDIFSVDKDGNITANAVGTGTLNISSGDYSRDVAIIVNPKVTKIIGVTDNIKIKRGSSKTLSPELIPEQFANEKISYNIKNTNIATVNSTGKIKGKQTGKTKLTISAGGCSREITITVYEPKTQDASSNNNNNNYVINKKPDSNTNNSSEYFSNSDDEYF